ncbi:bifunctional hydroxymethylpyrimidine kinase/phosphomethylpyrimidine kinase [Exiguobacterium sp. IPCH1]|nr:bifunctional hydroxymethylpyrimidine kinase/phosphomethylpyrimidine kinase [Exiguobacterium sp. s26]TCI69211.1 bifunctional hydroxymethylpyrimidine kinase/phosphomethylpyrimidine kinase [Exiguobacterium sp. IPCI3]TCI78671.1 bifunctional hydroxymethylpyrimidine kinase/phosphomethylpyrimidine kinase [Exiguobacterium sp. IPCH1]TCI81175.1 bifunctional hydroxymethylpyrimidine kinase/phosphomethylpyrimidine kinase [Exiguobacterium sp. IPBC4]
MIRQQVLTIAGSDSGGGAGIQADLKTFQELGVFGTSVLTAVTAQNTRGVHGVEAVSPELVTQQLDAIGSDFTIAACKTGMLFDAARIEVVADGVRRHTFNRLVVDPVMIAKGGASLLQDSSVQALKTSLLPLATVVTPNVPEAEVLTGMTIRTFEDRIKAAEQMLAYGVRAVILKGGHLDGATADDLVMTASETFLLSAPRIQTSDTHGTGCTFSAALTAELAKGHSILEATVTAKRFIQSAITHGLDIGAGHGPTNHWAYATHGEAGVTLESITTNHR